MGGGGRRTPGHLRAIPNVPKHMGSMTPSRRRRELARRAGFKRRVAEAEGEEARRRRERRLVPA
jgi:hypothetical protein